MKISLQRMKAICFKTRHVCVAGIAFGNFRMRLNAGVMHEIGFVDSTGKLVIPRQFDDAQDFSEGLAAVSVNSKWGYTEHCRQAGDSGEI